MALALLYVMLALGLNIVVGFAGLLDLGYVAFYAVGAYLYALLASPHLSDNFEWIKAMFPDGLHMPIWAVVPVAALVAAFFGVTLGAPTLKLRGDYLAIVTLGFGEIIRIVFNNAQFLGAATGYFGDSPAGLPTYTNLFWVFFWVIIVLTLAWNITFSQTGRSLAAIREDEIAAEAMATPTTRLKVLAFSLSAAGAGIAGGLFAHMQSGIRPEDFKFDKSIDMIVMIIVGGLGSVSGAALGGVFVAVSLELMRDLHQYRLVLYALLLIVIMLVRPQGILGARELPHLLRSLAARSFPERKATRPGGEAR
jgi:branched-chain amino acid transport system permease protein